MLRIILKRALESIGQKKKIFQAASYNLRKLINRSANGFYTSALASNEFSSFRPNRPGIGFAGTPAPALRNQALMPVWFTPA